MSSFQPRIAVLIPAHNAEKTLPAALASLAANDVPHDIVIVDDASRVEVKAAIHLPHNATVLRMERNVGVTRAANHGLRHILRCGYEYVARLDADDTTTPDRLSLQISYMDQNPLVALCGGAGHVVSEAGATLFHLNYPTGHDAIVKALYYNSCFLQPSFMIRTSALREFGLYDESFPNAEDYELVRRMARHAKLANLPHYIVNYTVSSGGLSVAKRRQQLRQRLRVQWRYRNFVSLHFYLGIMKTLLLWYMPLGLLAEIKRRLPAYRLDNFIRRPRTL